VCVPRSQSAGLSSTRGGGGGGCAASFSASGSRRERFGGGCAASSSGDAIGLGPGLSRVGFTRAEVARATASPLDRNRRGRTAGESRRRVGTAATEEMLRWAAIRAHCWAGLIPVGTFFFFLCPFKKKVSFCLLLITKINMII